MNLIAFRETSPDAAFGFEQLGGSSGGDMTVIDREVALESDAMEVERALVAARIRLHSALVANARRISSSSDPESH